MHKLGTILFLLFGVSIVGSVVYFATNTQKQFTALQNWAKAQNWHFETPGNNRRAFRITANAQNQSKPYQWTLEAIQGDKAAPPSLDAKPKTIWHSPPSHGTPALIITPHLPESLYKSHLRQENQDKLFEYILGNEGQLLSAVKPIGLDEKLRTSFTAFADSPKINSILKDRHFVRKLLELRRMLDHSPILAASPEGISVRVQTMVFGPNLLRQIIDFGETFRQLLTNHHSSTVPKSRSSSKSQ